MLLLLVANFELKHDSGSVLRGGRVFVLNCAVCVSVIFFFGVCGSVFALRPDRWEHSRLLILAVFVFFPAPQASAATLRTLLIA